MRSAVDVYPWERGTPAPSPLEFLPRLSRHTGVRLYLKRDDEGGRGGGGNKLRKFRRQFAAALAAGADTVVLAAHPQSNAARELAGAAAAAGLKTVLVMKDLIGREGEAFSASGNALLISLTGAEVVQARPEETLPDAVARVEAELHARARRPYVIPFGASDRLGVLGYVDCAEEILAQMDAVEGRAPDLVVVATGTGGTQAGLVAGLCKAGAPTHVLGFTVLKPAQQARVEVARLAAEALEVDAAMVDHLANVSGAALGDGYGVPTTAAIEAIRLVASLEGIFLDPVYTGKAMAGLLAYLESADHVIETCIFVHTGGSPLIFAYADAFNAVRSAA